MLESVRENLKGTLVIVVVIIFIVPMVIGGVGSSYLGSVAGTDAAKVNGLTISNTELGRAIQQQRSRIIQQSGLDASSPYVSDERLRGPVLNNLTRRLALVAQAKESGMDISDGAFGKTLSQQSEFFVDGKFNQPLFRSMLAQARFSTAQYRQETARDMMLEQQDSGLVLSAFSTPAEFEQLVNLTHQKRSFYSVKIPVEKAQSDVEVLESDLETYYEANKNAYAVEEKIKVEYIELTLDQLAAEQEVAEEDVLAEYQAEIANFVSDASYSVAHILIEDSGAEKIAELEAKLAEGADFAELAKVYSDDVATSDDGGELGILSPEMFPKAFEEAVYLLEEGEVSEAVETDAGTHFIKAITKTTIEVPSLESRRAAIASEIARAQARELYPSRVESLAELTFSSDGLKEVAQSQGIELKQTAFFGRANGSGIATDVKVREAAFSDEVLVSGHNSNTIEISGGSTVVIRKLELREAYTKPLEEVKALVEAKVREEKTKAILAAMAESLKADLVSSDGDVESVAKELAYEYSVNSLVTRSSPEVDRELIGIAFQAAKPADAPTIVSQGAADGGFWLVGLTEVVDGKISDLEDAEKIGFLAQVGRESANFEGTVFEALAIKSAEVVLK